MYMYLELVHQFTSNFIKAAVHLTWQVIITQ